jgi:hypothetical protein
MGVTGQFETTVKENAMDDMTFLEALWAIPAHEPGSPIRTGRPATASDYTSDYTLDAAQVVRSAEDGPRRPMAGIQRQGDVLVVPVGVLPAAARARVHELATLAPIPIGREGLPVVSGRHRHAHQHCLIGWGGPSWAPIVGTDATTGASVGVLTVPDGAIAHLIHTGHHASLAIPPGRYVLRRQRSHTPTPVEDRAPSQDQHGHGLGSADHHRPRWRTVWD